METVKFKSQFGIMSRPDGSVLFCEDETAAIAGIYGPVEAKMQNIQIDKASVECNYKPKSGHPGVENRFHESLIRNICETSLLASLYPRSAVIVNIQEMHNSGQLISCAINAACLACLDSGIDMKSMFAAVTCFLTKNGKLCFKAPINKSDISATFVLVFDNIYSKILASHTQGAFTQLQYEEALELCKEQSKNVFSFYKSLGLRS